jgi:hypothetical protein
VGARGSGEHAVGGRGSGEHAVLACGPYRAPIFGPVTDADDLYGLPLDRFVPERGALAKALRGKGRKEEAASIAARRKPSVAAWTVNQLIRTQSRAVATLFEAGDELQRAQSELLAGRGDARALRGATQRERAAVDELARAAGGLLSSDGHEPTRATVVRVSETLHAAALDEDARAQVRAGCLERELRWVGFGASGGEIAIAAPDRRDSAPRAPARRAAGAQTTSREEREREAERERAERGARERAERELAERERAGKLKAARKAETAARRLAERAARDLHTAEERRDRAAASLREAEDAVAAARERADEAALDLGRAEQALEG